MTTNIKKNLTPEQEAHVQAEYRKIKRILKSRSKSDLINIIIEQGSLIEFQKKKIEVYEGIVANLESKLTPEQVEDLINEEQPAEEKDPTASGKEKKD